MSLNPIEILYAYAVAFREGAAPLTPAMLAEIEKARAEAHSTERQLEGAMSGLEDVRQISNKHRIKSEDLQVALAGLRDAAKWACVEATDAIGLGCQAEGRGEFRAVLAGMPDSAAYGAQLLAEAEERGADWGIKAVAAVVDPILGLHQIRNGTLIPGLPVVAAEVCRDARERGDK